MKKVKDGKGITLIALVITIIVLLIMAGVVITSLSGENSIMNRATLSRDETEDARGREILAMEIMTCIDDKGNLNYDMLNERIKKIPGLKLNDNTISESNLISKESLPAKLSLNGYSYRLDINGYIESYKRYDKKVREKLKLNLTASSSEEKTPYVMYNGELYRVLYDIDSGYGWIEIISDNSLSTVKLGYNDPTRPTTAPGYEFNVANKLFHERARWSYNNAFETLNNEAQKYFTHIADRARCVGSDPVSKIIDEKKLSYRNDFPYMEQYGFNNKIKSGDTNDAPQPFPFTKDINQLDKLGIKKIDTAYWIAARYIYADSNSTLFEIRYITDNGLIGGEAGGTMKNDGTVYGGTKEVGFRPVIRLKANVKIRGNGDGTKTNPYVLSN